MSDSLALRFAKNEYVTAEISCSTVHAHDEVLIWSPATLWGMPVWASPRKPWLCIWRRKWQPTAVLGLHWSDTMVTLYEVMLRLCYGYVVAAAMVAASARRETVLWLLCQPGESECLQFLWLLKSLSSFLVCALPTLVQWTVQTVWTARQLASRTGKAIHTPTKKFYKFQESKWKNAHHWGNAR